MKVLSIGTDRKLFEENSAVLSRSLDYVAKMKELHIIVFSLKKHNLAEKKIGNLYMYPTNSSFRIFYLRDAIKIAKKIIIRNGLNKGDFVITTQDPFETGLAGYKLKRKFNFPLQIQIHTDFLSPYFKNSFLNRIRVVLAKFLIPKADSLRVVSSVISDSVKKEFPNLKPAINILSVFVDTDKIMNTTITKNIKDDFPQLQLVILMVSRLTREKNINIALQIMKKVKLLFPKTGLVIVGDGPEKRNLENTSNKLGLSQNVKFVGWQDNLISYYKSADLFLLTSEYEGYGMILIEAGTAGCPIVTTKVGIADTDFFQNGINSFVCPVGDAECLAGSILKLISNQSKRESFGREIQQSVKSISISREDYIVRYVSLLENLLRK